MTNPTQVVDNARGVTGRWFCGFDRGARAALPYGARWDGATYVQWIIDRLNERDRQNDERRQIANSFDKIWAELWGDITRFAAAYRQGCSDMNSVVTSGTQSRRMVGTPKPGQVVNGRVVEFQSQVFIEPIDNNAAIQAGNEIYRLVVDSDSLVYLMIDDVKLKPSQVAQRILDPLLFPDLPRLEASELPLKVL